MLRIRARGRFLIRFLHMIHKPQARQFALNRVQLSSVLHTDQISQSSNTTAGPAFPKNSYDLEVLGRRKHRKRFASQCHTGRTSLSSRYNAEGCALAFRKGKLDVT